MFFLEPTLFSSTLRSTGLAHIIGTLRGGVSVDTFIYYLYYLYVTLEHKTSHKSMGYMCSNSQKYIVWVNIIAFSVMPKIIMILSKDHVPWR